VTVVLKHWVFLTKFWWSTGYCPAEVGSLFSNFKKGKTG